MFNQLVNFGSIDQSLTLTIACNCYIQNELHIFLHIFSSQRDFFILAIAGILFYSFTSMARDCLKYFQYLSTFWVSELCSSLKLKQNW